MWGSSNLWACEVGNTSSNSLAHCSGSYMSVMHREVRVLVVDHDSDDLLHTGKQLELCHYKVSVAELASRAMQMLSTGKVKFDFIVANINSPDLLGFNLLQQASSMSIPVITMSYDDNAFTALRAVENGAFFYVKKPTTKSMFETMWQHLAKDMIQNIVREKEKFFPTGYRGIEFREVQNSDDNVGMFCPGNMLLMGKESVKSVNYMAGLRGVRDAGYEDRIYRFGGKVKRKVCTEWTRELHQKFMAAVTELGEGRCFPKDIIELMKVPGLTRMQVASHLQKCRNDNWRFPDDRKTITKNTEIASPDSDHVTSQKRRRFGSLPKLNTTTLTMKLTCTAATTGGGASKTPNSEIGLVTGGGGGVESPENESVFMNMNENENENNSIINLVSPPPTTYHQGNMGLGTNYSVDPAGSNSSSSEDFFNFADDGMDCLVPNYSDGAADNNSVDRCRFESYAQSSKVPSVDSRSPETPSTFGSDSEIGGQ